MKHVTYNRYPIGNKRFLWKQDNFVLSTFSCCPRQFKEGENIQEIVDKSVKHLKEAGFNMLELGWVGHEGAWAAVDSCEKYEINLLFQDMSILGGMMHHHVDRKVSREVIRDLAEQLKPKKYTVGYYVWDEPQKDEHLIEARRQMDLLQEEDPEAFLFTVAVPSYNNDYQWKDDLYAYYVEHFIKEMDPPVLSFDYYPIGDYFNQWEGHTFIRENQLDDTYMWLDMAVHKKLAAKYQLPFWFHYQGYTLYKTTDYFIFPMVRCFMYAAVLHGAKGLQHYAAGERNNLILKADGEKDIFFEDQQKIHAELAALGNTLMALDSKLVYHSAELLPDCPHLASLVDKIEDSQIFTGELPHRTSVGEFADQYGNQYVLILNRDYEKSLHADLQMKQDYRIYEVSREDGKQRIIHDSAVSLPLDLEPGDAVLYRVQKAEEEAFTIEYELAK